MSEGASEGFVAQAIRLHGNEMPHFDEGLTLARMGELESRMAEHLARAAELEAEVAELRALAHEHAAEERESET